MPGGNPGQNHRRDIADIAVLLGASMVTHLDNNGANPLAYAEKRHPDATCVFCDVLDQHGGVRTLGVA